MLQLAVLGIVLAWLYERTGSLWPPIALHVFNNALAFAVLVSRADGSTLRRHAVWHNLAR